MGYSIVTDSSANLPNSVIEMYDLKILPLTYLVNGVEVLSYIPNQPNDMQKFYKELREGAVVTTSCVSVETCRKAFSELLTQGEDVLYIGFSSALSGTFQSAHIAAGELSSQFPERKIFVADSLSASLGQGLLVTHAARRKADGESIDMVYQWVMEHRLNLCHWFTVDDLFFLKRGGRISATTALLGSLLTIKPVMHVDDTGHLVPVSKIRGRQNSLKELVRHMEETAIDPGTQTIYIAHGDCLEDAVYVADLIRDKFGTEEILIDYVEPVIGAHSGPGTVALFFLGRQR